MHVQNDQLWSRKRVCRLNTLTHTDTGSCWRFDLYRAGVCVCVSVFSCAFMLSGSEINTTESARMCEKGFLCAHACRWWLTHEQVSCVFMRSSMCMHEKGSIQFRKRLPCGIYTHVFRIVTCRMCARTCKGPPHYVCRIKGVTNSMCRLAGRHTGTERQTLL